MLSHSIDWHLLDVVHNILNMQSYVTSVAGHRHATSVGRRRREAANISASMKTFHYYDIGNSILVIWHHWRDRQVALGKLAMKMCGLQQDFVTLKIYQEASLDMPGQKITFKTKIALKTFGSAMIYFDFERTAETKYQLQNATVRENREILKDLINVNSIWYNHSIRIRYNTYRHAGTCILSACFNYRHTILSRRGPHGRGDCLAPFSAPCASLSALLKRTATITQACAGKGSPTLRSGTVAFNLCVAPSMSRIYLHQ